MNSPSEINEAVRLTELYQLGILDTQKEEYFEALVDLGISAFNWQSEQVQIDRKTMDDIALSRFTQSASTDAEEE